MKLINVAKVLNGELSGVDAYFYGASSDTRTLEAGQLFFAWKGEHSDAHEFLESAEAKGAIAAVVERFVPSANITQILVKDSQKALGILAKAWRKQWQGTSVALTGSNGKTTVKEMLFAIFSEVDSTLATKGNLNNHVGCPLTLLQLSEQFRYAVIEMGANHPQEIAYLTNITKPDIALLNNAGACHLEGFGNIEGVANAKAEIFEGLSDKGIAIINGDDDFAPFWKKKAEPYQIITFGIDQIADVYATNIHDSFFILHYKNSSIEIALPLVGRHNILNACAAAAAAIAANLSLEIIKKGLESLTPVEGRMQKIALNEKITLINDGYNANPSSLKAAIDTLSPTNQKNGGNHECWLILGDMRELGENEIKLHEESGLYAKKAGFNRLLSLGMLAQYAARSFGEQGQSFTHHDALLDELKKQIKQHKNSALTILVKGSNSMNMQYFVDELLKG